MPREGGASSNRRHWRLNRGSAAYWIVRPSAQLRTRRTMTARVGEKSFLLPRKAAEARQGRLAAEAGKSGQIRQALTEADGKILGQLGQAARTCAALHLLRHRLHLLG